MNFDLSLFLCALGLAFAIESACYAAFPAGMRRMLVRMTALPPEKLRAGGLCGLVFGVIVIWIGRTL